MEHKIPIENDENWKKVFLDQGLNSNVIKDISHDDSMWYYKRSSTCVLYGDMNYPEECKKYEGVCAGGDNFGSSKNQAFEVKKAIENGGEHPKCPLIYLGTD